MTCAKTQVFVTLTHPDGRQWTGTNWCRNPQAVCPRAPGEDYTKCKTVCDQFGHAELDALRLAGADAAGCTASLRNHTYYCMPCQHAMFAAGVAFLGAPGPRFEAAATETDGRSEAAKPPASIGADGMDRMNLDEFPVGGRGEA